MHQFDILPFPIGTTFSQNGSPAATDGQDYEGRLYWVEDYDYNQFPSRKPRAYDGSAGLQGNMKLVRVVRNVSGITLQPRRLVTYKFGTYRRQVDGYCTSLGQECFPIDEFLPYNVPTNDLFYITVKGMAECLTALEASAAQGLSTSATTQVILCSQTAVTSQSTTSGRVVAQDLTGATAVLGVQIQNRMGIAMSARTTNQTNTAVLVYVDGNW